MQVKAELNMQKYNIEINMQNCELATHAIWYHYERKNVCKRYHIQGLSKIMFYVCTVAICNEKCIN